MRQALLLPAVVLLIAVAVIVPTTSAGTKHSQRTAAPYACTQAIHEARVLSYLAGQGTGVAGTFIPLIQDAAIAGANNDAAAINRIVAKIQAATVKIRRLTKSTNHTAALFNGYAARCQ